MARKPASTARSSHQSSQDQSAGSIVPRLIVVVTCIAAIGAMVYRLRAPERILATELPTPTALAAAAGATPEPELESPGAASEPTVAAGPTLTPSPAPTMAIPTVDPDTLPPRVGIVAGHWGSDTGAVCPDGLQEVNVNVSIAVKVVQLLESLGYEVDLLEEFDARLDGYDADVLVSIHADSCEPFPGADPPLSGFKVASVEESAVPAEEQRLVECLADHYAARTGMRYHASTVTYDMTRYHTFYEVAQWTPAAIIETGFLYADRHIINGQPALVAQAIAEGIVCFLEPE